ncbi:MAG: putative metal-dependent hydrolase, partial [Candidatus Solibacter sp.]|nr:putative metal-dependent hydrolase [Candidatus Solibacter sp.]
QTVTPGQYPGLIEEIAAAPALYRDAVRGLDDAQLDTPYRPEGWTVRQTVHHVADSHMNSFIRMRLGLTETEPAVRPYNEKAWAQLSDSRTAPVELSLQLIESLHARWALLLKSLSDADFGRRFVHPALGLVRLDTNLALYAWHGRHHAAHINGLRQRNDWK